MPKRRQAITWTNADSVHWRIYAALGGDGLINVSNMAPRIHLVFYSLNCYFFLIHGCKICMNIIRYRADTTLPTTFWIPIMVIQISEVCAFQSRFCVLVGCVLLIFISDCDAITHVRFFYWCPEKVARPREVDVRGCGWRGCCRRNMVILYDIYRL